jgi:hypothetical protein
MANKTSITSTKAAKKAAAKRVAAKGAQPPKAVAKSSAHKPAKDAPKELPTHYTLPKAIETKSRRPRGGREADPPRRRQPSVREGRRRRPRAGLHRGHARLERDVGRRLDKLIVRTVPGVRKAVKWNSPFYGIEGQGWFLSFVHTPGSGPCPWPRPRSCRPRLGSSARVQRMQLGYDFVVAHIGDRPCTLNKGCVRAGLRRLELVRTPEFEQVATSMAEKEKSSPTRGPIYSTEVGQ